MQIFTASSSVQLLFVPHDKSELFRNRCYPTTSLMVEESERERERDTRK
jgi:hypothetical protein